MYVAISGIQKGVSNLGRPPKVDELWMPSAAELMVRNSMSLAEACTELRVGITTSEIKRVLQSKGFQRLLWTARNSFYQEIAANPECSKRAVVGQLHYLAQKLIELGDFDKAGLLLEKVAKIEGWTGGEGQVNVFANLTQRDIDDMKDKLAKEAAGIDRDIESTRRTEATRLQ